MAVVVKAPAGLVELLLEAGDAEGVSEFSMRFTMVIKVDVGISRFGYPVTMRSRWRLIPDLKLGFHHSTMNLW